MFRNPKGSPCSPRNQTWICGTEVSLTYRCAMKLNIMKANRKIRAYWSRPRTPELEIIKSRPVCIRSTSKRDDTLAAATTATTPYLNTFFHKLPTSVEQYLYWEAHSYSDIRQIPLLSLYLTYASWIYSTSSYIPSFIYVSIISCLYLGLRICPFSSVILRLCTCIQYSHSCYMFRLSHIPWFDHFSKGLFGGE